MSSSPKITTEDACMVSSRGVMKLSARFCAILNHLMINDMLASQHAHGHAIALLVLYIKGQIPVSPFLSLTSRHFFSFKMYMAELLCFSRHGEYRKRDEDNPCVRRIANTMIVTLCMFLRSLSLTLVFFAQLRRDWLLSHVCWIESKPTRKHNAPLDATMWPQFAVILQYETSSKWHQKCTSGSAMDDFLERGRALSKHDDCACMVWSVWLGI
jgi:hypothetical protein